MIRYKTGFIYSMLLSMVPSIFMAILVIVVPFKNSFGSIIGGLFFWVLITIFISFIVIVIFGIPIVKILNEFNLVNIYTLVTAGGLVGLALALFIFLGSNVQDTPIKVLLIASGLLGGYGFWYGINKRE
ncbi:MULTISPECIES: hypothetical protein [sulfur-oxidizing symbionts]|uniref:Membrane protein n=3 Tax=sulfur-oxidizing symbionts TaxID=32036 RepID=A0A1H6L6J8_9GAMM|nr:MULTISPECIES: hypothetical protein [sulfur-oxidizing symbionts]CAC9502488.1 hypothetical protein [uncultured Gammaproteobacteria bacterium]CAC9991486.1 hypothetical protein [uncultured Gammaproteobacteria bacterium]SEH83841.1 membrane protein [Bathymodiolus azoricus thioautotrophic gill symbiont]VVH60093.1 hypothetical protein BAZOLSSOX_688 [uncultured Gammaproteobacteria bacterium]